MRGGETFSPLGGSRGVDNEKLFSSHGQLKAQFDETGFMFVVILLITAVTYDIVYIEVDIAFLLTVTGVVMFQLNAVGNHSGNVAAASYCAKEPVG